MANPKHFILLNDGFTYKGRQYSDHEIAHLYFQLIQTTVKTNFVATTGKSMTTTLRIHLKTGEKITISAEGGFAPQIFVFRDNDEVREEIVEIYRKLAERTFESRLHYYLDQLQVNGYFLYDECRFYPRDRVNVRGKDYGLGDSEFLRSPGSVELRKKNRGFLGKVAREIQLARVPGFSTEIDTDVIFFLLDKLFNLRWS